MYLRMTYEVDDSAKKRLWDEVSIDFYTEIAEISSTQIKQKNAETFWLCTAKWVHKISVFCKIDESWEVSYSIS